MKRVMIIISFLVISLMQSCEDNPVNNNHNQFIEPGTRNYMWRIDTLKDHAYMAKLWGSKPNDVWAIGSPGNFSKSFWHYDGNSWSTDNVFRWFSPLSIYGFSTDNIWSGGKNGQIWHFDGSSWGEDTSITLGENRIIVFDNMWGESPNNLFATGAYFDEQGLANKSIIAQYNGSKWTLLSTYGIKGIVERYYKNKSDGKIYLRTNLIGGAEYPDSTLIYVYHGGKYTKIYSSLWEQGFGADISLIENEVYFVMGNRIAKRKKTSFETFLTVDNPKFYQRIWGRNSKDIFMLMTDGLAHYNGTDIEYLFHFDRPRTQIYKCGAALFEDEVFFLADEFLTGLYLIYHGVKIK